MTFLYRFFPWAMRAREMMDFLMAMGLYLLLGFAAGIAVMVLCLFFSPLSFLWLALGALVALYTAIGLVCSVLCHFGVL